MKRSRRILIFAVSLVLAFTMLPAAGITAFAEDGVADDPALEAGDDGQAADEGTDGQPEPAAQPEQAEPAQDGVEAPVASEPELTPAAQLPTRTSDFSGHRERQRLWSLVGRRYRAQYQHRLSAS